MSNNLESDVILKRAAESTLKLVQDVENYAHNRTFTSSVILGIVMARLSGIAEFMIKGTRGEIQQEFFDELKEKMGNSGPESNENSEEIGFDTTVGSLYT